jgi:uncharacterized protein YbaR (Trm112 family)
VTDREFITDEVGASTDARPNELSVALPPWVIALLVCPVDRDRVKLVGSELVCNRCGRRYPVHAGIPDMIPDHARIEH